MESSWALATIERETDNAKMMKVFIGTLSE
jgi:hypothetical protein